MDQIIEDDSKTHRRKHGEALHDFRSDNDFLNVTQSIGHNNTKVD